MSGKTDFEIWAATFGAKINRNHVDHGIFFEQLFRLEIEDFNQTIKFCGVGSYHQNTIFERNIKILTLGSRTLLPDSNIYWPEAIPAMLLPYELRTSVEQFNGLKVDDDVINTMEKFAGTTPYITLKNHHIWGCPVYVSDERFECNIYGIPKWEPCLCTGIYIGHQQFHAWSVDLVLNSASVHVSTQFHVVFDYEFYTVTFVREVTITPN